MRMNQQEILDKLKELADSSNPEDRKTWTVLYWKSQDLNHDQIAVILDRSKEWVQRYSSRTYKVFGVENWLDDEKKAWMQDEVLPAAKELIKDNPFLFTVPPKPPPEPSRGPVIPSPPAPITPPPPPPPSNRRPLIIGSIVVVFCLGAAGIAWWFWNNRPQTPTPITAVPTTPQLSPIQSSPTQEALSTPRLTDTPLPTQVAVLPTSTAKPYYDEGEAVNLGNDASLSLSSDFVPPQGICSFKGMDWGVIIIVRTSNQFTLRFNTKDFAATDDIGTQYQLLYSGVGVQDDPLGTDINYLIFANGKEYICVDFKGKFPLKANYLLITANWINGNGPIIFRKHI